MPGKIRNPILETRKPNVESAQTGEAVQASGFDIPSDSVIRRSDVYVPRTLKLDLHRRGRLPFDECLDLALAWFPIWR